MYSRYSLPIIPVLPTAAAFWPNFHIWASPNVHNSLLNPPPQSMFTFVGVAPRRHFTVAPDWRHLSN